MTRDEAIKVFNQNTNIHDQGDTGRWVDRFVRLGMLKLDDRAYDFATEALEGHGLYCKSAELKSILDRAGLKIVEK